MKYQLSAVTSDVYLFLNENLCCNLPEFQMTMHVFYMPKIVKYDLKIIVVLSMMSSGQIYISKITIKEQKQLDVSPNMARNVRQSLYYSFILRRFLNRL